MLGRLGRHRHDSFSIVSSRQIKGGILWRECVDASLFSLGIGFSVVKHMGTATYIVNDVVKVDSVSDSDLPPASLECDGNRATVRGYQSYELTRTGITALDTDANTTRKSDLLSPYFTAEFMSQASVLDLGSAGGFYSFWAALTGARSVLSIDIDDRYVNIINEAAAKLEIGNISARNVPVFELNESADIVIALAILHWMVIAEARPDQMERSVAHLSSLTNRVLIVEWTGPDDKSVRDHAFEQDGNYSVETFEACLSRHFQRFYRSGNVKADRLIYIAFKDSSFKDKSCSLPDLMDAKALISSRRLKNAQGTDTWSRVWDAGNEIIKQVEGKTACYEGTILSRISSPCLPTVKGYKQLPAYSTCTLEKIDGKPLVRVRESLLKDRQRLYKFISGCLKILIALQEAGVSHRDVSFDNLLVRQDGSPVLIDFGWAITKDDPRPDLPALPDYKGDAYYMGRVLYELFEHDRRSEFSIVVELLTGPPEAYGSPAKILDLVETLQANSLVSNAVAHLLEREHELKERIKGLESENAKVNKALSDLISSKSYKLAAHLAHWKQKALGRLLGK
jgi:serine/threonine protein kinase